MPTLLEDHLGPTVAEVVEEDGDEFVDFIRLVRDREDEALRRDDLEILPLPMDLATVGVEMGTSDSGPPNQSANGSGSVHSPHTRSRGASNTRVILIRWFLVSGVGGSDMPAPLRLGPPLRGSQALVQAIEAAFPEPAVGVEPLDDVF